MFRGVLARCSAQYGALPEVGEEMVRLENDTRGGLDSYMDDSRASEQGNDRGETVPDCSVCGRPSPIGDPCEDCEMRKALGGRGGVMATVNNAERPDEYEDDYELDDGGEDWYRDPFEDALMNCGLVGNTGLCMKAGSEECDWECPFSH